MPKELLETNMKQRRRKFGEIAAVWVVWKRYPNLDKSESNHTGARVDKIAFLPIRFRKCMLQKNLGSRAELFESFGKQTLQSEKKGECCWIWILLTKLNLKFDRVAMR